MNELVSLAYGYARAIWRRRWPALGAAWLVALLGWLFIMTVPDKYEASAVVYVDARSPLRPVLEGIGIKEDYESQLYMVREALLSRPHLEKVARDLKLAGIAAPGLLDAAVNSLMQEINVAAVRPANTQGPVNDLVYTINYQNDSRERAIEVVNLLLKNFMQGTQAGSRSGTSEVKGFLNEQITDLEQRLQSAEQLLAQFKKENIGLIPGGNGDYFTRLNTEMAGLQKAETDLAVALSRRAELRRQLDKTQPYLPGTGAAGGMAGVPDVTQRRQESEKRMEELLLTYTERHPEVVALQRTIAELKDREARELAELQSGGAGTGAIRSLTASPVYQQMQSQLSQVQVEVASHQGAATLHRKAIAELRKYVNLAPEVEQKYASLNRDYDAIKQQYEQLVAQREQANVSSEAAQTGIVRFELIEPPRASADPVSPKRGLLVVATLLFAIGAGIALAVLPRVLIPTVDDVSALSRETGLPVLGAVSVVKVPLQRTADQRDFRFVVAAFTALFVLAGVVAAFGSASARLMQQFLS